uniref:RING-type domain-containing protein n=1 Tax=viral metagenome TaxID=1070528 RepID=A0A6C0DP23_9ZZZZ
MNCGHMVCEDCVEIMMKHYVKDLYCIHCHRQTELAESSSQRIFDLWNFLWNIYNSIISLCQVRKTR